MQKLVSELIGSGVILRQENALAGRVQEVVISPENRQLLGFVVQEGFGKKKLKTLAAKDVLGFNEQFILIPSYKSLAEPDEIIRIKEVQDGGIKIIKSKVYTISGIYLGKVKNYSIDFDISRMSRIYVNARSIRKLIKELIIEAKCIVSINKDKIIVDDTCAKEAQKSSLEIGTIEKELPI